MRFPESRILIFLKAPVPGQVMTRLAASIGEQAAAALYRELLFGVIDRVSAGIAPIELWCSPDTGHEAFRQIGQREDVSLFRQEGDDLGQRMAYAAAEALQRSDSIVLIGGDSPVLGAAELQRALSWLESGDDAVIGPAEDGGYVLLGVKQMRCELFQGVSWGSDRVLEQTRYRLRQLGWSWRELAPLWDLDRPTDLERYRSMFNPRSDSSSGLG